MTSLIGSTGVLIDYNAAFNPSALPGKQSCYFFDPKTGNMTSSTNANCDATYAPPSGVTSNKVP
jgi:hypothetical protein